MGAFGIDAALRLRRAASRAATLRATVALLGLAATACDDIDHAYANYCAHGHCAGVKKPTALAFTTSPPTAAVNQCSNPFVIELRDATGAGLAAVNQVDIAVSSDPTTTLFTDQNCTTSITS